MHGPPVISKAVQGDTHQPQQLVDAGSQARLCQGLDPMLLAQARSLGLCDSGRVSRVPGFGGCSVGQRLRLLAGARGLLTQALVRSLAQGGGG